MKLVYKGVNYYYYCENILKISKFFLLFLRIKKKVNIKQFTRTASYYFCWYHLNKNPLFKNITTSSVCPNICELDPYCQNINNFLSNSFDFDDKLCSINFEQNKDLNQIKLNKLNITCKNCEKGKRYELKYFTCIDIDECAESIDNCKQLNKSCLNTIGSFKCI